MHFSNFILMTGIVGLSSVLSGAAVDITKLPPASAQKGLTYEKDIRPILEASCVRCHSGEKPKEGLWLDTLTGVRKGSKNGKVLVPGKSEKSLIVIAVSRLDPDLVMPPTKPAKADAGPAKPLPKPLTAAQVGLIRAWIDQGAK